MQKHVGPISRLWAGASLALLVAACGSSGTASGSGSGTATCVNASAAHRAYVVVEHLSGKSLQRCVGFSGDAVDAETLMKQSGIEYQAQTTSFGKAVCQIDNEPAHFSECFPKDQPFWSLWVDSGGSWSFAQSGYTDVKVRDHEALGWRYVPQTGPTASPPPLPTQTG